MRSLGRRFSIFAVGLTFASGELETCQTLTDFEVDGIPFVGAVPAVGDICAQGSSEFVREFAALMEITYMNVGIADLLIGFLMVLLAIGTVMYLRRGVNPDVLPTAVVVDKI